MSEGPAGRRGRGALRSSASWQVRDTWLRLHRLHGQRHRRAGCGVYGAHVVRSPGAESASTRPAVPQGPNGLPRRRLPLHRRYATSARFTWWNIRAPYTLADPEIRIGAEVVYQSFSFSSPPLISLLLPLNPVRETVSSRVSLGRPRAPNGFFTLQTISNQIFTVRWIIIDIKLQ